jgi:gliding motility-associatede transport system auxiliary component
MEIRRRSLKFGANSALMILLFLGILVIINFLGFKHHLRADLSSSRTFTLAPQSVNVVKALKEEVKVTGFFQENSPTRTEFKDLIESYRYYNPKIRYELVDPDKNPGAARQYGITQPDTVVLESGTRNVRVRNISEQEITSALIRLSREGKRVIYFLEGHGEHRIGDTDRAGYSNAKEALERQGFEVRSLLLLEQNKVPSDAAVLVVAGPERPILPQEQESLKNYLNEGGQLLVMLDPQSQADLDALLLDWGVRLRSDMVIDPVSRLFGGVYNIPIVNTYFQHDITRQFNLPTFFPLARSVRFNKDKEKDLEYHSLIQTSPSSWATTNLNQTQFRFDPKRDERGPIVLAAAVTVKNADSERGKSGTEQKSKKARLVVFGDSDFASNLYFRSVGNGDLFLNAVTWLARYPELISIRPKEAKVGTLLLTSTQGQILFYLPVVALPLILIGAGVSIWQRRKRL